MREVKLIWDDSDSNNEGWFMREYDNENGGSEDNTFDADENATAAELIEAAGVGTNAEVSIYRSISSSIADETVEV